MNDRYLYRAKRTDNGEWVEGYYFCMEHTDGRHTHHFIIPIGASLEKGTPIDRIQVEVDPYTICQCTGLIDKNGARVFIGDIVRCSCGCPHVVIWLEEYGGSFIGGMPAIYLSGLGDGYAWTGSEEVIGNIFYNPELLEVGE